MRLPPMDLPQIRYVNVGDVRIASQGLFAVVEA
jgi:hypothetical protein